MVKRTVVIHAGTNDLGRTDHPESKKTGNAGARPACGKFNWNSGVMELVADSFLGVIGISS